MVGATKRRTGRGDGRAGGRGDWRADPNVDGMAIFYFAKLDESRTR